MAERVAGKAAFVTGGSRGVGAAIVERLAARGASVAFTYGAGSAQAQEVVRAIESSGGKAFAVQGDAADPDSTRAAVAKAAESLGGTFDIFVNNAGLLAIAPIDQFQYKDFDRMIAVNIKGMFVARQESVRHMRDGGRIILIGSCNSGRVPFQGGTVYALTKGAVVSFTKALARDLGPRGITVNNVQPGPSDTDMNPAHGPGAPGTVQHVARGRYAKPEAVASFVAYLASPEASYITGASLLVDGGYSS
jgi:3-oxoacyl-[acyl-carrier protein] reductase